MGVDGLVGLLVVIATWQALAAEPPARYLGLAAGVGLVGVYAWGRATGLTAPDRPRGNGSAGASVTWLLVLGLLWIGLLIVSPAALWLAFPLMIVQVYVLGAHRGAVAVVVTVVVDEWTGSVTMTGTGGGCGWL